jgi:hypothetical protein
MGYVEAIERQLAAMQGLGLPFGIDSCADLGPDDPTQFAAVLRAVAGRAETYDVAGDIVDLLIQASETIPRFGLTPEDLPALDGWIYLERSLPHPDAERTANETGIARYRDLRIEALLWTEATITPTNAQETPGPGLMVAAFASAPGIAGDLPYPVAAMRWRFGEPWPEYVLLSPRQQDRGRNPETEDPIVPIRWFMAFLRFIKQRILVATAIPVRNRSARRRIARVLPREPIVHVIELRRREYRQRDETEHEPAEWSCQWLVRGHWHNYHTREGLQPRWVDSYVKGPDDKPLKTPRATVYKVVR